MGDVENITLSEAVISSLRKRFNDLGIKVESLEAVSCDGKECIVSNPSREWASAINYITRKKADGAPEDCLVKEIGEISLSNDGLVSIQQRKRMDVYDLKGKTIVDIKKVYNNIYIYTEDCTLVVGMGDAGTMRSPEPYFCVEVY